MDGWIEKKIENNNGQKPSKIDRKWDIGNWNISQS